MIGTHDQIGENLGVSGNTARNWISALAKSGLVTKSVRGKSVEIRLVDPYLFMARLPEAAKPEPVAQPVDDPRMALLRTITDAAAKADTKIKVEMVI